MVLKPTSEAFFNVLEYLDKNPSKPISGEELSKIDTGIDSYFLEVAVDDGYLIEKESSKYIMTSKAVDLLNNIRLRKAIERFDKASKISSIVMIILTIVIAILTGVMVLK